MSGSPANTLWARSFVDELARHGVLDVVLAPGSRSTPLVLACAADGRFRMRVHLDERSAAFFALGAARASRTPVAVITTSGTATANLFPAVIEASAGEVPLLLLTADRPHHLRDADANQAIDQVRLFGGYPRLFQDVAPPTASPAALRHLRALAGRAVAAALGPPAGPVHLNFPFEKPLEPLDSEQAMAEHDRVAYEGRPDGTPFVVVERGRATLPDADLGRLAELLDSPRGVIVVGPNPEPEAVGAAALKLAERTGFPLLADPLSGARYRPACGAHRLGAYDLLLGDAEVAEWLAPSVIVRAGNAPTSATLQGWLARHRAARQVVFDAGGRWRDHAATAAIYVRADAAHTLLAIADAARRSASEAWTSAWVAADAAATEASSSAAGGAPHEGDVLAAVVRAMPDGAALFVSSSMPVRDLDAFAGPRHETIHVHGNRGASGIDGIVSTAFGVASRHSNPTVCVLGDIAFFHDQNGLLWSREDDAPVVFVLIDNDGGAIFHMLPVADHEPHFTEYFATPHGLDLRYAAELHGIGWTDVEVAGVEGALRAALEGGRTTVLRVATERASNHARHVEVRRAVAAAVREALRRQPVREAREKD